MLIPGHRVPDVPARSLPSRGGQLRWEPRFHPGQIAAGGSACRVTSSRAELRSETGRPTLGCVLALEPHVAPQSASVLLWGSVPSEAGLLGSSGAPNQERRAGSGSAGPQSSRWWGPDRVLCPVFRLSFSDSESDNSADSCLPSREPPPSKKPPPPNSKVSWGMPRWPPLRGRGGGGGGGLLGEQVSASALMSWRQGCGMWTVVSKEWRLRVGAEGGLVPPRPQRSICCPWLAAFRVRVRRRRTGASPRFQAGSGGGWESLQRAGGGGE